MPMEEEDILKHLYVQHAMPFYNFFFFLPCWQTLALVSPETGRGDAVLSFLWRSYKVLFDWHVLTALPARGTAQLLQRIPAKLTFSKWEDARLDRHID